MAKDLKKFRGVIPMTAQQVAQSCIQGLQKDSAEVLVGWQSHVAVWCHRLSPQLLEYVLHVTAPKCCRLPNHFSFKSCFPNPVSRILFPQILFLKSCAGMGKSLRLCKKTFSFDRLK